VLDGVTNYPARRVKPADVRIAEWISDLDKLAQRKIHRYASLAAGAELILYRNRHLTREQAVHLATHGLKQDPDGTYGWKFGPYLRARTPYRFRSKTISDCGRASRVRRFSSAAAKVFCPTL
jgi:hypothetical protein